MIYGDYHTHTTWSHGKGGIEDNVRAAVSMGLREIAITDHGLSHIFYNVKRKKLGKLKEEIEALRGKYPDINILFGIEANMTGRDGAIDLTAAEKELFDIILCGYHVSVWGKNIREQFGFLTYNQLSHVLFGYGKGHIKTNTRAYIQMIEKNPVAVLTHINFRIKSDVVEVAKAARDAGTFIEISGKRTGCSDDEIAAMAATGVKFILSSDAHSPEKIGDVAFALDITGRLGIPYQQIANWDKPPVFRKP